MNILLLIIFVPMPLARHRIETTTIQLFLALEPNLTNALDNFLTAIASACKFNNRLNNCLQLIRAKREELRIQSASYNRSFISAAIRAFIVPRPVLVVNSDHIPRERCFSSLISKIIMVKSDNLPHSNKPVLHVVFLLCAKCKHFTRLTRQSDLINFAPRKMVQIFQRHRKRRFTNGINDMLTRQAIIEAESHSIAITDDIHCRKFAKIICCNFELHETHPYKNYFANSLERKFNT